MSGMVATPTRAGEPVPTYRAELVDHARCTTDRDRSIRADDGAPYLTKTITVDEPYLSGHYPGNPVFPGVFDIDLSLVLLTEILDGRGQLKRIEKVRFMHPLAPGDMVRITATEITAHEGERRFRFLGVDQDAEKVFTMTVKVTA